MLKLHKKLEYYIHVSEKSTVNLDIEITCGLNVPYDVIKQFNIQH